MAEPTAERVVRKGVDKPGGRNSATNTPHALPDKPRVFGEPFPRISRITAAKRQIHETVVPLDLVDYELHEPPIDLTVDPLDLVASDLPEEPSPENIKVRWLKRHTAHFNKPYSDPERKFVGFSTYPHQVEVDTDKDVRPIGPNDAGELILTPSFSASLLAKDIGKIPTSANFWYAKNGKQTVMYDPKRKVLYLG